MFFRNHRLRIIFAVYRLSGQASNSAKRRRRGFRGDQSASFSSQHSQKIFYTIVHICHIASGSRGLLVDVRSPSTLVDRVIADQRRRLDGDGGCNFDSHSPSKMRRRRLAWLRVPKIAFFIFLAASCTHGAETQSDADVIDTALFSHDDAAAANAKAVTKATLADTLAAGVAQAKANAAAQDVSHRLVRADESSSESATGSQTWQPEMGQITCCNGGTPTVPENVSLRVHDTSAY